MIFTAKPRSPRRINGFGETRNQEMVVIPFSSNEKIFFIFSWSSGLCGENFPQYSKGILDESKESTVPGGTGLFIPVKMFGREVEIWERPPDSPYPIHALVLLAALFFHLI